MRDGEEDERVEEEGISLFKHKIPRLDITAGRALSQQLLVALFDGALR
jgi:hypothetical protein